MLSIEVEAYLAVFVILEQADLLSGILQVRRQLPVTSLCTQLCLPGKGKVCLELLDVLKSLCQGHSPTLQQGGLSGFHCSHFMELSPDQDPLALAENGIVG